jgi:CHAT domain-containing protein
MRFLYLIYLNVLLLCLITRQLPAQIPVLPALSPEILVAEQTFVTIYKNSNHWKTRFLALFQLEDAYDPYFKTEYAKHKLTYFGTTSYTTAQRQVTFNLIHQLDSLRSLHADTSSIIAQLHTKWAAIYRYKLCYDNWNDLADHLMDSDLLTSIAYRSENYKMQRRLQDTTSSFFLQQTCLLVEMQTSFVEPADNLDIVKNMLTTAKTQQQLFLQQNLPIDTLKILNNNFYYLQDLSDAQADITYAHVLKLLGDAYWETQQFKLSQSLYKQSIEALHYLELLDKHQSDTFQNLNLRDFDVVRRNTLYLATSIQVGAMRGLLRTYSHEKDFDKVWALVADYLALPLDKIKIFFGKERMEFANEVMIALEKDKFKYTLSRLAMNMSFRARFSGFATTSIRTKAAFTNQKRGPSIGLKEIFGPFRTKISPPHPIIPFKVAFELGEHEIPCLLYGTNLIGIRAKLEWLNLEAFIRADSANSQAKRLNSMDSLILGYSSPQLNAFMLANIKNPYTEYPLEEFKTNMPTLAPNSIELAVEFVKLADAFLDFDNQPSNYQKIIDNYENALDIFNHLGYTGRGFNYVLANLSSIKYASWNLSAAKQHIKQVRETFNEQQYSNTHQIVNKKLDISWKVLKEQMFGGGERRFISISIAKIKALEKEKKLTLSKINPIIEFHNNSMNSVLLSSNIFPVPFNQDETVLSLQAFEPPFAALASVFSRHPSKEMNQLFYNLILTNKGVVLEDVIDFKKQVSQSDSTTQRLVARQDTITKAFFDVQIPILQKMKLIEEYRQVTQQLQFQAPRLFSKANKKSGITTRKQKWREINWSGVRNQLKTNEVAIEIVHFNYRTPTQRTNTIVYYAGILRKGDSEPTFVRLFEASQLNALLKSAATEAVKTDSENAVELTAKILYHNNVSELYNLIWQPIENSKQLIGCKNLYIASTGLLHQIALAALRPNATQATLGERYHLEMVNSTREIHSPNPKLPQNNLSAVLVGDVPYAFDSTSMKQAFQKMKIQPDLTLRSATPDTSESGCNVSQLSGSLPEVQYIDSCLHKKGTQIHLLTGYGASEDAFRAIVKLKPTIIHISTHGEYRSNPQEHLLPVQSLHNNFLFMAGCKRVYCKEGTQLSNMEDGLLTAAEVADMKLEGTQLVVLSACETGLGDLRGQEGAFGLARAFKLAGATYQLVTLWQVDDAATAAFMKSFYEACLDGKNIQDAFRETQNLFKAKHPKDPHKWAGFVLIR